MIDLFRGAGGRIVEPWDVMESITPEETREVLMPDVLTPNPVTQPPSLTEPRGSGA